ncbi:amidase family protein [Hoeflea prorocentri]|uniref:Amidase family protein n=1 Tax=Hoeflea prorocentri TaxID=1922333 RepID=A0A9X3UP58_9HYPH|nr:amidase family protein [Hoeflea prorocentri]MCY6382641.1 amidase family protein [Hoeflea prorocentri]MDA5400441.1 amidase family protein [Hoeflea prorocentri]
MSAPRTASKLVAASLDALKARSDLNLTTQLLEDSALDAAARQDEEGHAGSLCGLPFVVKANVAVAGALQDGASPALTGNIATKDAQIVARLRAEGAIPVAMTNMHELAFGITSQNAHYGPVRNPHDPNTIAGGSSGGTAAAIAAGAVRAGIASDTGGSGRLPAAFCGCVGLRPTQDRYPKDGILTLSHTLDTLTVMGSDVATVIALDAVVTGDTAEPEARSLRLGVLHDPFWTGLSQEMSDLGQGVLSRLTEAGFDIIEGDAPDIETLTETAGFPIALNETKTNWEGFAKDLRGLSLGDFAADIASTDVRALYETMARGEVPPPEAYAAAMKEARPALKELFAKLFDEMDVDAFIFPTLARTAPSIESTDTIDIDGNILPLFPTLTRRELAASVAGLPAISLPAGTDARGLPFGMELIGRDGADRALLGIAKKIERSLAR